ncbi:adenylate/guanylate cyclase domain-containing protein [Nocardioides sp.]|uniref:adenylate/guanylate cyclase domain-containing protein n=1 Tax=Nocardioides sp. TaxID=35761 RepID=UPI00351434DF
MPAPSTPYGSRLLGSGEQSARRMRVRVQLLLTVLVMVTNLLGAVIVFVITSFVIPAPSPTRGTVVSLAIAVPTYVVFAVVVGGTVGTTRALRAMQWWTLGREPGPVERDATLRVPWQLTRMQGLLWTLAFLLFTGLAVTIQPERALTTGATLLVAGVLVGAIAHLFVQFALRPIAARALTAAPFTGAPGTGRASRLGRRMVLYWLLGTAVPVLALMMTGLLSLAGRETSVTELSVVMLVVGGVVLIFGLFITVLNTRAVVAPVESVRDAMRAVERGDLDRTVAVFDATELGQLQAGFNQMAAGLREREHLRDLFGRHVGHEVAAAAAAGAVELGGEARVATVLFVDLVGSTRYATEHGPTEVVGVLNRFFGVVVDEIDAQGGLVNKFIGDAVLAVFGAPVDRPDHARAALEAARRMAARLAVEVPEVGAGIGVTTGEVVAGNVGHRSRFEYTVIGDAVNSASRLTDLAKQVPGRVLVARATLDAAGPAEAAHWRPHDDVVLRGRTAPTATAVLA